MEEHYLFAVHQLQLHFVVCVEVYTDRLLGVTAVIALLLGKMESKGERK